MDIAVGTVTVDKDMEEEEGEDEAPMVATAIEDEEGVCSLGCTRR